MSKGKSKSRTLSKSEREMQSYLRLQNMGGFIEHIDKKLEYLTDDISLLLALTIAEPAQREEMVAGLRAASIQAEKELAESAERDERSEGGAHELNE